MSKRLKKKEEDAFEYHGKQIALVKPETLKELVDALSTQDIIRMALESGDCGEGASDMEELLKKQEVYIEEYAKDLPDYDNTYLNKNIKFLLKHHKLRMGDMEHVLGLTKGYISRTMKKESFRKLSIDVAWKIANMFGVELDKMIDTDFSEKNGNLDLIQGFIRALQTESDAAAMAWRNVGGVTGPLETAPADFSGIISDKEGYMSQEGDRVQLAGDVFVTRDSDELRTLGILPYKRGKKTHYDFVFFWIEEKADKPQAERAFGTEDDKTGVLDTQAKVLYECVRSHLEDVPLSPEMKEFMKKFIVKGR